MTRGKWADAFVDQPSDHDSIGGAVHHQPSGLGGSIYRRNHNGIHRQKPVTKSVNAPDHWVNGEVREVDYTDIPSGIVSTMLTPEEARQILGDLVLNAPRQPGLNLSVSATFTQPSLTFPGHDGKPAVRITIGDPPTIWVDESLAWDMAAKQFWNGVYRIMGKPAPFPG